MWVIYPILFLVAWVHIKTENIYPISCPDISKIQFIKWNGI